MSAILDAYNQLGEAWLAWLLERSLAGAIALGVVLLVLMLLPKKRLSAHLPSHLLLLPFLVFVVPIEHMLPGSFPRPMPAVAASLGDATVIAAPPPRLPLPPNQAAYADSAPATVAPAPAAPRPALQGSALAMSIWLLVFVVGLLRLWRRQHTSRQHLERSSEPADAALLRQFCRLARASGVHRAVTLRLSRGVTSPLVAGMVRPTVYLPTELAADLDRAQLEFVLRHELEHVRRRDVLLGTFTRVVHLAFCFHPAVWIANALLTRWREYACDEAALAQASGPRVDIADTLFTLVERACGPTPPASANALLLSPRTFMKHRLLRILDSNRRPHARMSTASALMLALTTVGALTAARPQQPDASPARDSTASFVATPSTDTVATALTEAATYLLRTQQPDGSWAIGPDPSGANQRDHNSVSVTAMAIRALLPGLKDETLKIAQAVQRATVYLEQSQAENGRFGPRKPLTMMYAHAHALRALCAVQQEWPTDKRLDHIRLGVAYALKVRNPYMGWRYQPRDGDNDSKITGMMLLGLQAARELGVSVESAALDHPMEFLDQLTNTTTGRTGFTRRGEHPSRFTSKSAHFPGELSEECTALTLLARSAAGASLTESPVCQRGVALIAALPPVWDEESGSIDLAYWEFGAQVMAQVGGAATQQWRAKLHAALLPARVTADGAAHWPAVDAWSHPGMEAYTTASAMLALRALR